MKGADKASNSPLRYAGAKKRLAKWIISLLPEHSIYCEPFGGSAAVLFKKSRVMTEVYNDAYGEVVNFFKVLRDNPEELKRALFFTPFAREELFNRISADDLPVERARKFIFRSHAGFGTDTVSLNPNYTPYFRSFRGDGQQSPASDWVNVFNRIQSAVERFRGVVIEHADASEILKKYDTPNTLFYVDPPYLPKLRRKLYRHEFSEGDTLRLLRQLKTLKAKVALSGLDDPIFEEELPGWEKHVHYAYTSAARHYTETVWTNYKTSRTKAQNLNFEAALGMETTD